MSGLLETSRIPVSLLPERSIVEAARDEGIKLDQLKPARVGRDAVFEETAMARRVLGSALQRWREVAPSWRRLNFTMQHQEQTEWCWAAASVSVSRHYDQQTGWTQCKMVNAEKGLQACCEDGSSVACNKPNVLDSPLNRAEVLDHKQDGSAAYDMIRQEIDAGRPLAWRIGWSGGGGHFAVIEGYQSSGEEWVAVEDPWYGVSDVAVSTLTGGMYQGSGSWTHTYFTRPQQIWPVVAHEVRLPLEIWERARAEEAGIGDEVEVR
jgi:Papain-like cysteine protease AvrRpt2